MPRGGGSAGGGGKKLNVAYNAPEEPAFLRRMKEQLGYKPPATIDDKRARHSDHDEPEIDIDASVSGADELAHAQIVQLKQGDLDEDQVAAHVQQEREKLEKQLIEEGRITFKKPPPKRPADSSTSVDSDSGKCPDEDTKETKKARVQPEITKKETSPQRKLDSRLLSFGDDDCEDDEQDDR